MSDPRGGGCDLTEVVLDENAYYKNDFTVSIDFKTQGCDVDIPGEVKLLNRQGSTNKDYTAGCVIIDAGVWGVSITPDAEILFSIGPDDVKLKSNKEKHPYLFGNQFHRLAITRSKFDGVIQLFIDGDLIAIGDGLIRESLDTPESVWICGMADGSNQFNGARRNLKFYADKVVDVKDPKEVGGCPGDFRKMGTLSEDNHVRTIPGMTFNYRITRFWTKTMDDCAEACRDTAGCSGLSYGGDTIGRNPWYIGQKYRCELYYRETPNASRGDNVRFCRYKNGAWPKCRDCGMRERECWTGCDKTAGPCEMCNSPKGQTGYCCRKDVDDHPACALFSRTPELKYMFFDKDYHMCVVPDQ